MENFIIYTMETVRCLLIPPADKVTICFSKPFILHELPRVWMYRHEWFLNEEHGCVAGD